MIKQAYSYVSKTSTFKWVDSFLKDLKIAYKPTSVSYFLGLTVGFDFRIINTKSELRKLDIQDCSSSFFSSNKCVIFLDHEALPILDFAKNNMYP